MTEDYHDEQKYREFLTLTLGHWCGYLAQILPIYCQYCGADVFTKNNTVTGTITISPCILSKIIQGGFQILAKEKGSKFNRRPRHHRSANPSCRSRPPNERWHLEANNEVSICEIEN